MAARKEKQVSLSDVARKSGFSVATVSKVLNNTQGSRVSEEKASLILKIAGELNYRPNRIARYFESGKTGQIAYVIPHEFFTNYSWRASSSQQMEIYMGAVHYLATQKYMTNLIYTPEEDRKEFLRSALLAEHSVDGVIIFAGEQELELVPEFEALGISVVSFDWNSLKYNVSHVEENPTGGVMQAVEYLKKNGHKSAGCLFFKDSIRGHQAVIRSDVIIKACRDSGIEINPAFVGKYYDETDAYVLTREMFSQNKKRPGVMFYPADHSAMMGIKALTHLNLKVPEDVSVVGFDDAPFNVSSLVPLSTIAVPRKLLGENGAKLLLEQMNDPEKKEVKTVTIHTEFIKRESTGPAPVPAFESSISSKSKSRASS